MKKRAKTKWANTAESAPFKESSWKSHSTFPELSHVTAARYKGGQEMSPFLGRYFPQWYTSYSHWRRGKWIQSKQLTVTCYSVHAPKPALLYQWAGCIILPLPLGHPRIGPILPWDPTPNPAAKQRKSRELASVWVCLSCCHLSLSQTPQQLVASPVW